jgi:ABC-2 type transport system ATP-binding protein
MRLVIFSLSARQQASIAACGALLLAAPGITVINDGTDLLRVSGTTAAQIGTAAWRAHLPVYELTPTHASLEEAFMQVTKDSIEYHAGATR